jgi:hypothetical protein
MKALMQLILILIAGANCLFITSCRSVESNNIRAIKKSSFHDKMKGAWAGQVIGVTYGFPVEFKYNSRMVPDSVQLVWNDSLIYKTYMNTPGAYDDIYVDLTFLDVYRQNKQASSIDYARAFENTSYDLWFANQVARNNLRNGIMPPESGHWRSNPECTSIDFQIESDFIGLLNPGRHKEALELADKVGHIMAYGDGYYGGVFVSQMYAAAMLASDINEVITKGLAPIPQESLFYEMINDVVQFYKNNPNDWKACWKFINDKYQDENGSPFGAQDPWNIEASMNSCHVVTGLLYGQGDFLKSIEIATRCGNDADCNPGTVAGILGAMNGFSWIPNEFTNALQLVKNETFLGTNYTLDKAIEVTEYLAIQNIKTNGDNYLFEINDAPISPLEIARPDHHILKRTNLKRPIDLFSEDFNTEFEGNGIVIFGKINSKATGNDYIFEKDTAHVSVFIDNKFERDIAYPVSFENRKFITYYNFDLTNGNHNLKLRSKNPLSDYTFDVWMQVEYTNIIK